MVAYSPLITTLVSALSLALILGYFSCRLHISPIVGYLIAGIIIGPATPGFVADPALATELADLGIILLMFGVGLHFSIDELYAIKSIAITGALVQMSIATLFGCLLAHYWGWSWMSAIIFGISLSVASTVVLIRALEDWRSEDWKPLKSIHGKIAIGWLVAEDLAMVVIVVFLPPIAAFNQHAVGISIHNFLHDAGILIITVLKAVAFIALMLIYGRRLIPKILHAIERTGSHELFRLAVFVIALVVAFMAAKLFGVSFALGAFFAGMILNESALSHRAAEETLPLRDAFAVLFFVAMGMLFQPTSLFSQPLLILMTTIIIIFGKSLATFLIVILFRYPVYTALMISASLAQIGEFSFILAEMGTRLGLLTQQAKDLIIAASLISIILNPLWFRALMKIKKH